MKTKSFTDLIVWKKSHKIVLTIYKITLTWPNNEKYALSDQIKRSSISISSNIAEGFYRQSKKEKIHFYFISLSSLAELQNQLLIARDVGYLKKDLFNKLSQDSIEIAKMLNTLISRIKKS